MILSREQVRTLDRRAVEEFGVPAVVLMENAGRGAAELLRALGIHARVAICCGKGNNGGDGFVIARHLDLCHVPVGVLFFGRPSELTGEAATNYRALERTGVPVQIYEGATVDADALRAELARAEWVVDALFG